MNEELIKENHKIKNESKQLYESQRESSMENNDLKKQLISLNNILYEINKNMKRILKELQ